MIKIVKMIILLFVTFISCRHENKFYFQIEEQKIINCNKKGVIINLDIENDSIKENGNSYEVAKRLRWENSSIPAPYELSFDSIPKGYVLNIGGIKDNIINKYKFMPNCRYTIQKKGYGDTPFIIKIWTDSTGKVYKTTHPKCGLESLKE